MLVLQSCGAQENLLGDTLQLWVFPTVHSGAFGIRISIFIVINSKLSTNLSLKIWLHANSFAQPCVIFFGKIQILHTLVMSDEAHFELRGS
jgi:hypothetical protein